MSPDSQKPERPDDDELELAHEDDAVIGRAFQASLRVLLAVAAVAAIVFLILRSDTEEAPTQAIETEAPVAVERPEAEPPAFELTDVTQASGIAFVHENGARGDKLLPESMGSGALFFDADNDGDDDLLLINGTRWPHDSGSRDDVATSHFYRNDGKGQLSDASRETGLDLSLYGTGVCAADVDGDGWRDVYVAAVGTNRLLRNQGGRFEDVTASAEVAGAPESWSTSCAFFDLDNDGDLDLYVGNYVRWSKEIDFEIDYRLTGVGRAYGPPINYQGSFSYLFRNQGDGRFEDISATSGIAVRNPATDVPVGKALGVVPVDFDGDGYLDLMVANDTVRNFVFRNMGADRGEGDAYFEEVGELWGLAYGREGEATGAMGIDAAYLRNDDDLGVAIGNFANEMTSLYIAQGDPTLFADESIGEGVGAPSRTFLSFGVLFLDVDLDGRLDILQTNGHLENEINAVDPSQTYAQASQLFWNAGPDQRQTFVALEVAGLGDLATPLVGRGSAYSDIDGDGDLDVVLTQTGRPPLLLRNDQQLGHHWLGIRLEGRAPNTDAIGAWVTVTTGETQQRQPVMPSRSYQSQSTRDLVFGLGSATTVDSVVVRWPDGSEQQVTVEAIDRLVTVEQTRG